MNDLANAIALAKDKVEGIAVSDKAFRDAVYAEAGVKNKADYFESLINGIYDAYDTDVE